MFSLALLSSVAVVGLLADLTGVTVSFGDCLCVSGNNVYARDSPSTSGAILGTFNTGDCFIFTGTSQTGHPYNWYQVTNGAQTFWIAGTYLIKVNVCPFIWLNSTTPVPSRSVQSTVRQSAETRQPAETTAQSRTGQHTETPAQKSTTTTTSTVSL